MSYPSRSETNFDYDGVKLWLKENGCIIDKYLSNIEVLKNKGVSESIILFGDLKINKTIDHVVLKMIFNNKRWLDNSLITEQQIYENVISNLISNCHTPHLVKYIGIVKSCDTELIKNKLSPDQKNEFDEIFKKISIIYDKNIINIMILSKSQGITLTSFFKDHDVRSTDKFKVLFQILYTLKCFEHIGLSHNDLHANNIFVDKLKAPVERIYYITKTKWIKFTAEYDVKIYDFDRGSIYHPAVDRNLIIDRDYCDDYNQCNSYDSKRDLSSIFAAYILYEINTKIFDFVKSVTSSKFETDVMTRKFGHLNTGKTVFDDTIIKPISECIDLILVSMKSEIQTGEGSNIGEIYTLPPINNFVFQKPITSNTHLSRKVSMSTKSVNKFSNEYINNVFLNMEEIVARGVSIYVKEFNDIYQDYDYPLVDNQCKTLFTHFIKEKNIDSKYHNEYMEGCYIMCFPFTHKFTRVRMIDFLETLYTIKNPEVCSDVISDIWNTFNNILPINMVII